MSLRTPHPRWPILLLILATAACEPEAPIELNAAVLVGQPAGPVNEYGIQTTIPVRLTRAPSAPVVLSVRSADPTEGTVSPASLTFDASNFGVAQDILVTGVSDDEEDGDVIFEVTVEVTESGDPAYAALGPRTVQVVNEDTQAPIFVTAPVEGTSEAGASTQLRIHLTRPPTAPVTVRATSLNPTEAEVAPAALTIAPEAWQDEHLFVVTGLDDDVVDGDQSVRVRFEPVESDDPVFAGRLLKERAVVNRDDDVAGFAVSSGTPTHVFGRVGSFSIRLTSRPRADVSVTMVNGFPERTRMPSDLTLTFHPETWDVPQTVEVEGRYVESSQHLTWLVGFHPAVSDDRDYAGLVAQPATGRHQTSRKGGWVPTHVGTWTRDGAQDASIDEARVGKLEDGTRVNGYATFDFSTDGQQIYRANLRVISNFRYGTVHPDTRNVRIHQVSTPIATLHASRPAGIEGIAIYEDLRGGDLFGQWSATWPNSTDTVELSAEALSALNAQQRLAFGFNCTNCDEAGARDYVLLNKGSFVLTIEYLAN